MPSTFLSLHYHIVFSTNNRVPWIEANWQHRLHDYIGGILKTLGAFPQAIGGVADHVHLLVGLRATHSLADITRELKKSSSVWIHDEIGIRDFHWQDGYAAFTVSPTARDQVRRYIDNQEEHHRTKTFREELVELLNRAGIEYEDKYLD